MNTMHERVRLYISPQRFVLEPLAKSQGVQSLEIDRTSGKMSEVAHSHGTQDKVQDIFGVLGTIKLLSGPHLIAITSRKCVGKINGAEIWKVLGAKIYPFHPDYSNLTPAQALDEATYVKMLEWVLTVDGLYFSYSFDLTNSLQRTYDMPSNIRSRSMCDRADQRFFWNRNLLSDFMTQKLDAWAVPVIMGFVKIEPNCRINNQTFEIALVSRRNVKRVGTRYNVRGVDVDGNVANSVETEQIISFQGQVTSLIQIRGSIPLYWKQKANLKYKPKLELHGSESENAVAIGRHFQTTIKNYDKVTIINLIDQKGSELALGQAYENAVQHLEAAGKVKYVAFDFHRQCSKMRYDRLSLLLDEVRKDIDNQKYFYVDKNQQVVLKQSGVCRTNCIDNLDRTNVVQSLISRESLSSQLTTLGIFKNGDDSIVNHPEFHSVYRNLWADHADAISMQYSGTGALKNDFTRTGVRSWQGLIQDGTNSLTRYVLNNFNDGFRQDSFDLWQGNYTVNARGKSPFSKQQATVLYIAAFIIIFCVVASYIAITPESLIYHKMLLVVIWMAVLYAISRLLLRYGRDIVSKPLLYLKD